MLDGLQGGHVARGVQVPDREALLVQGRLGEDHTELDLPGGARPSGSLPCRPAVSAGTAGIPVPSTATYSLAIRVTGPSGTTSPTTTAAAWVSMTAAIALPSASAQRSTLFAESSTPASSASRSRPFLNGTAAPTRPTIAASPGASERGAGEAQLLVSWNHTVAAIRAVVLRLAQLDRPEHGHDGLSSVGDELREMT